MISEQVFTLIGEMQSVSLAAADILTLYAPEMNITAFDQHVTFYEAEFSNLARAQLLSHQVLKEMNANFNSTA